MNDKVKQNLRQKLANAIDKAVANCGYKSAAVVSVETSQGTYDQLLEAYDGYLGDFWFAFLVDETLAYPQIVVRVEDIGGGDGQADAN